MMTSLYQLLTQFCRRYPATISYVLFIVLLNTLFSYVPELTIHGAPVSIADVVVGLIYVLRDFTQREIKHWVIIAMLIGCLISYGLAEKAAAIASLGAFGAGELIDWAIFTFTGKPLSQRILLSSLVSAPIDSFVNLYLLHQLNWPSMIIMMLVKTLGIIGLWYLWRTKQQARFSTA